CRLEHRLDSRATPASGAGPSRSRALELRIPLLARRRRRELANDLPCRARESVRAHQADERLLGLRAPASLRVRACEELKRLLAFRGELDPALGEAQG